MIKDFSSILKEKGFKVTQTRLDICKKVSNFDGCKTASDSLISKALKQNKDFNSISHHSFDLFGVCNKCSKNA
ncbi:MAG: hypothetical protein NTV03_00275 [Candidatus Nomurabacteria bacterium]|nr:hypothetical protein [Candidatus Nomurabacteria bacterium]